MRGWAPADPDAVLLRRAARSVAVQTGAAIALVVLVMAGSVLLLDAHQQRQQAQTTSRGAWARADDVGDPPAGTWLVVVQRSGPPKVSPGAPAAVRSLDPRSLPDGATRIERDGRELEVWSGEREIGRVSAVYDLTPSQAEARRLLVSLAVAAGVGVLGAAAVGTVIGRRAVRPLMSALSLQRRFVADASHELRTPLTVLLTRAQLLRRHLAGRLPPEREGEIDRLVSDARNLGGVVNDLLLSAELEHRPQVGEELDVAALAEDVTESLRPLAAERGVHLSASTDDSERATVRGVEAALRRAVTSLLDNAIAHSAPEGHVRVTVAVSGPLVVVGVADEGDGLDPREAHRLLERFSRGTAGGAGRRFGLGLALVDEVARAHGGVLDVDGELGRGATFSLRLPRVD